MPESSVDHHRLALNNARWHAGARLLRRELDGNSLSQYAGLATDGHHLVTSHALHQHITHHAENAFRGLNDLVSKVAATTGQCDTPMLKEEAGSNRTDLADLTRVDTDD